MAVRIKDGEVPYTGGIGIEITNNHVINVLLRELNNLIHVTENRELYVDLQLDDGIKPEDSLPVGVTTGRILKADGRPQSGTILNWKTTSGDQVSLIYANDDCLYYSVNGGAWRLLAGGSSLEINTKTFPLEDDQDFTNAQAIYDWYKDGNNPLIKAEGDVGEAVYILYQTVDALNRLVFKAFYGGTVHNYSGYTEERAIEIWIDVDPVTDEVTDITFQNQPEFGFIDPNIQYDVAFNPTEPYHPTSKKYVDDELLLKQDKLIAGTNISIAQDGKTISATLPGALVYKGNVQTIADLPSSGQTVGDTYFVEGVDGMYSWDGTQWNYVGSTTPSLTNYFNKTIDDSDDITEGSIHLFVTQNEKNIWNNKQDALTAGDNINIDANNVISSPSYVGSDYIAVNNHVISNLKPFIPENDGALGQVLKKTSTGYEWKNDSSNFNPENDGTTGQVLKKTETGYAWANESGGGGGGGTSYNAGYGINITGHTISNTKPFEPTGGTGVTGDVLIKTADGYEWGNLSGTSNVRLFTISSTSDLQSAQDAVDWLKDGNLPILKYHSTEGTTPTTGDYFYYPVLDSTSSATNLIFTAIPTNNQYNLNSNGYTQSDKPGLRFTLNNNGEVININDNTYQESRATFISPTTVYDNAFIPTHDYEPTSKKYVDSRNWVGTQAQYDNLPSIDPTVIYNIIPSS